MIGLRVLLAVAGGAALIAGGARGESPPPVAPGCAEIVAVLDEGGGLSAEEVARKTHTDVETVRDCTDRWRRQTKGGAKP